MPNVFSGRRLLATEVVQTSAMDCGPAALKCLLEGFGLPVSYDRLREACQTDVDGTSIDTLEEIAGQLGLAAEQVLVPADHLLLSESRLLPALLVVRLPNGFTHFVVVWRRHGGWFQVMDPAVGRRWLSASRLAAETFIHAMPVPGAGWREWAGSNGFQAPLEKRLASVAGRRVARKLIGVAEADPTWFGFAALDAGTRLVEALVHARGVRSGREAAGLLESRLVRAHSEPSSAEALIPRPFWAARRAGTQDDEDDQIELRGAVLLRVARVSSARPSDPLPASLTAAVRERRVSPWSVLVRSLRDQGIFRPALLGLSLLGACLLVTIEAVLLSGAISVGSRLSLPEQRLAAALTLIALAALLLVLESGIAAAAARLGRRLEMGLRVNFLAAMLRSPPRYLGSRPISDLVERLHAAYRVRTFPRDGLRIVQIVLQIVLTGAAMVWVGASIGLALLAVVCAIVAPLILWPLLFEQDLRVRTHTGALSRFYFETLAGLIAVRAHSAGKSMRREQESLLVDWARASRGRLGTVISMDVLQGLTGFGLAIWIILEQAQQSGPAGAFLLIAYWALTLPLLGEELSVIVRRLPNQRNITLRLIEPLRSGEVETAVSAKGSASYSRPNVAPPADSGGVALELAGISVLAGGHLILKDISLDIRPGQHVAVVGASGAGKSSLVRLLLGLLEPAEGELRVDGVPLAATALERLRARTAWIDPAVQLWNRSLLENLLFGAPAGAESRLARAIQEAGLHNLLARLPRGLQDQLGEGGGSLSGGEGQLVRIARSMLREGVGLAILDEPFRGLDASQRSLLLERCRRHWASATMLVVTHDIQSTLAFDRIVVLADGRVREEGTPAELQARPGSRYCELLQEEAGATLWGDGDWSHWHMDAGRLACR